MSERKVVEMPANYRPGTHWQDKLIEELKRERDDFHRELMDLRYQLELAKA